MSQQDRSKTIRILRTRFPGNPTQSYRTCEPLRIVGVVEDWEGILLN
ncbi:NAD(+)--rifampin ADP-ribosyltransferase [Klebsiella pneumoniae]